MSTGLGGNGRSGRDKSLDSLRRGVRDKWRRYAPDRWWGDSLDVRFHLARELRKLQGYAILDIGCGAGILLSEVNTTNHRYGMDVAMNPLQAASTLDDGAGWVCSSMCALPFNNASFDVVVAAHVVPAADFAVPDGEARRWQRCMMGEIRRVLKEGGRLLLTTPNGEYWAYQKASKLNYDELLHLLTPDFSVTIRGYNPLPPFPFFLPPRLMGWVPRWAWRYLFIPSPLLAWVPGIDSLLRWLMGAIRLRRVSKAFYVEARKT